MEVMYRWTQSHCRNVDNPQCADILSKAMLKLQDRPVLFKYIIDEYCIGGRGFLASEFINALTKGGPSGNPAPIEMRAHDPQIYITDMLVWINRAIPIEKQYLNLLVKSCDFEGLADIINGALANICEGICQPLKMRVDKILNVPNPASVLYAVVNMIRYYKKCITKLVKGGPLEDTLNELQTKSETVFISSLQKQVNGFLVRVETPPRDLSPTSAINHLLAMLRDMLATANMSDGKSFNQSRREMVREIGTTILKRFLKW